MSKVLKILNIILKVLLIIILGATAFLSLSMAYIMFAPDELPKPFRLVYQYPVSTPEYLPPGILPAAEVTGGTLPAAEDVEVHEAQPGEGLMVNMSTKIINLSDPSGRKYIRLTVVLEFNPETSAGEASESASGDHGEGEGVDPNAAQMEKINARMPLMDDIVITTLSTKSFDDLYTADGKESLRKEIQEAINTRLPELKVISVYFTEFVVQ